MLGRIVSAKLQMNGEKQGIFGDNPWGFRASRSTMGPMMIARLVAEMAANIDHTGDDTPPRVGMLLVTSSARTRPYSRNRPTKSLLKWASRLHYGDYYRDTQVREVQGEQH